MIRKDGKCYRCDNKARGNGYCLEHSRELAYKSRIKIAGSVNAYQRLRRPELC